MDRCPAEICIHIFSYACVDGGRTGRSLSLVSKYISEASKAVRLQSLVVCGHKLPPFLEMLANLRSDVRRCQHLFISDVEEEVAERMRVANAKQKARVQAGSAEKDEEDVELETLASRFYTDEEEKSVYYCISRILELNSSTLRTLTISIMNLQRSILFPISIPFLVYLSLISLNSQGHGKLELSDKQLPHLPSLNHLHVVHIRSSPFMHSISRIAPCLTQFRATGRRCDPFLGYLPKSTKKVLVQPTYHWRSRAMGVLGQLRQRLMLLWEISQAREQSESPLIILLAHRNRTSWLGDEFEFLEYGFHDALQDWRSVVESMSTFWDIEEEDPEVTKNHFDMLQRSQCSRVGGPTLFQAWG